MVLNSEMKERSARTDLVSKATNGPAVRVNIQVTPKQNFWSGVIVVVLKFLKRRGFDEERFAVVDDGTILGQ